MTEEELSRLEFVNDQERIYFAEAHLGEQMRQFLNGDIGRYLHGRAKAQYTEALEKCIHADLKTSDGRAEAAKAQFDAAVAEAFMGWCADAIQNGEIAYHKIQEEYGNE